MSPTRAPSERYHFMKGCQVCCLNDEASCLALVGLVRAAVQFTSDSPNSTWRPWEYASHQPWWRGVWAAQWR